MSLHRAIIAALILILAGCKTSRKKDQQVAQGPTSIPAAQQNWTEQSLSVPAMPARPVKEGAAPLVYLVETSTIVRVVDLTTSAELLNMPVMAHQIVSLNPELGVQVGGATMKAGSLPSDHRYGIFLDSQTENVRRIGQIYPGGTTPPPRGSQP